MNNKPFKAALITNIPTPYRRTIYELVSQNLDIEFTVLYCARLEPNRQWQLAEGNYRKEFLGGFAIPYRGQSIYLGSGVISALRRLQPDIVITSGFSMPMLLAFIWAKRHNATHLAFSDSHPEHELNLSSLHRLLRRIVYANTQGFLGPSSKTKALFSLYKKPPIAFFQTHLCADNRNYLPHARTLDHREFDFMFCGRICIEKKYDFFTDVVARVKIGRPARVLIVGDGPARADFLDKLAGIGASVEFMGFLDQSQLPVQYARARMLLFPTTRDAWGIVANEAMAVGTPVITCPQAGVAGELVLDGINGFVRRLDADEWSKVCSCLLGDTEIWQRFSAAALQHVQSFSYENAASGILNALAHAARL